MGKTTAAISGGRFEVASPKGDVTCSGNYDALDTRPIISAPVRCSDGRYGTITVERAPDGMSGTGNVNLADGSIGSVAFGREAASVLAMGNTFPPAPVIAPSVGQPPQLASLPSLGSGDNSGAYSAGAASTGGYSPSSSRVYTGNCPTPESLDAAGRRCGARSAASRPGGYDGYGAWASPTPSYGGTVSVRGHYRRNGTYVRGYTRRR
ncbi:hypothetical protein [Rhizobium gallicum]|uniref:hypothetical protein n=1 Tax=Rhizobium gallicum TaxID=56730 RepID=UPI001EF8749D|nr:hypothetical protein [Rhizobium gallicum]ULJ74396.1 hypothetical protein L2W42_21175 [Rhizobium gallicum]